MRIPGTRLLHSPGPTHLPDEVLDAMHRQPMDLGDARIGSLVAECESGLKSLLDTDDDVFIYTCNGHGVWEAVAVNLLAPGQAVLVPGIGHFSESWAVQTEALGYRVVRTPVRDGLPIDAAAIEAALRADPEHEIGAVFFVHTDTASSITSDIASARKAIERARHPALLVVDVVASLAAAPFSMRALDVDVAVGGSQKGLMLPPGLGILGVSARAFARSESNPTPRYYWDWRLRRSPLNTRKFCGTSPMHLLMGLRASLRLIAEEGLDRVHARHVRLAGAVQAAVDCWSQEGTLQLYCREPSARSVSVTAVQVLRPGIDPDAIRACARERYQVAIAGGLGTLAGRVFRIGHLGDMNEAMVMGCLGGVEAAMQSLKVPYGRGGVDHAIAALAS